jgi:CheY-like chemotaxis protein
MEELLVPPGGRADGQLRAVRLLVADDDRVERSLLAHLAREAVGEVVVFEAEDGAEAIQLGLQQHPEIAVLDVNMPRLGGIEAAVTLRELQPRMRVALQTGDPHAHRDLALENGLPLFGKLELDRTLAWLQAQVERCIQMPSDNAPRKRTLVCGACGYGAWRATPPDRCPMCQAENAWIRAGRAPSVLLAS